MNVSTATPTRKIFSSLASAFNYTCYAGATLSIAILLVGFVPQMEGTEVRRFVVKDVAKLQPEDYPKPIEALGGWSVRSLVTKNILQHEHGSVEERGQDVDEVAQWVEFSEQDIFLNTYMGNRGFEQVATSMALVLAHDAGLYGHAGGMHGAQLVSTQLSQQGEALTPNGTPLRWAQAISKLAPAQKGSLSKASFDLLCDLGRPSIDALQSKLMARNGYSLGTLPRVSGSMAERANLYKDIVAAASKKFGVRQSLILAIIQTESAFRPHVVSRARAMGLMQLLPATARSMHRYVYGTAPHLGFEQITKPEMNITLGTAFVKLMMTQYFHQIQNQRSREYCTIVSYNMGPGRLFPFFGRTKAQAIANINAMGPDEVYRRLVTGLPYRETRAYLNQVSARDRHYRNL